MDESAGRKQRRLRHEARLLASARLRTVNEERVA